MLLLRFIAELGDIGRRVPVERTHPDSAFKRGGAFFLHYLIIAEVRKAKPAIALINP